MDSLSFRDIVDTHERLKEVNPERYGNMDTSDFARFMQVYDPSGRDYSQGFNSNLIKHGSVKLDKAIEFTGLPQASESLFRNVGRQFGMEETGASLGRSLPRSFGEMAAVAGGFAAGGLPGFALLAGGSLSSGANAYTETGSPLAGVIGAGLTAATPAIARGGELATRSLLATNAGNVFKSPISRAIAEEVGANVAITGAQMGADVVQGNNPFGKEALFANVLGNVAALPVTGPMLIKRLRADPNTAMSPYQTDVIQRDLNKLARENPDAFKSAQDALLAQRGLQPNADGTYTKDSITWTLDDSSAYRKTLANLQLDPAFTNLRAFETMRELGLDTEYQALKSQYRNEPIPVTEAIKKLEPGFQTDENLRNQLASGQSKLGSALVGPAEAARWLDYWVSPKKEGVVTSSKVPILEGPNVPKSVGEVTTFIEVTDPNLKAALVDLFARAEAAKTVIGRQSEKPAKLETGTEEDITTTQRLEAEHDKMWGDYASTLKDLNDLIQTKQVKTVEDAIDLPKVINAALDTLNRVLPFPEDVSSQGVVQSLFDKIGDRYMITAESIQRSLGEHFKVEGSLEGAMLRVVQQMKNEYQTRLTEHLNSIQSKQVETTAPDYSKVKFEDAEKAAITKAYGIVSNKGEFAMRALDRVLASYTEAKNSGKNPSPELIVKNLNILLGKGNEYEKLAEAKTKTRKGEVSTETPIGENLTVGDTVAARGTETSAPNERAAGVADSVKSLVDAPDFATKVARATELRRQNDIDKAVKQIKAVVQLIQEGVIKPGKLKQSFDQETINRFAQVLGETGFNSDLRSAGPLIKRSIERLRQVLEDEGIRGFGEGIENVATKDFKSIISEIQILRTPKGQLLSDVDLFFNKFLDGLGMEPSLKEHYIQTAKKVAVAFGNMNESRLVELQNKVGRDGLTGQVLQTMGLFVPLGPKFANTTGTTRNLVALVGNRMVAKELEPFLKISALGHELFHGLVNTVKADGVDLKRLEVIQRMEAFANDLSVSERRQIAQTITDIMIPNRLFAKDKGVLEPMLDYVSKNGEEFTAFYAQMMSVGLAARQKAERRGFINRVKELVTFGSQYEADFVQGFYRNLSEMVDMLTASLKAKHFTDEQVSALTKFQGDLQSLMKTPQEMLHAIEALSNLNRVADPTDMQRRLFNADIEGVQALKVGVRDIYAQITNDPERFLKRGARAGLIERNFGNPIQFALEYRNKIPSVADVVANLIDIPALLNRYRQAQMLDFMVQSRDGQWVPIQASRGKGLNKEQQRVYNAVEAVETNAAANKAFSDIARKHNEEQKLLTREDAEKIPSFKNLSEKNKALVWQMTDLVRKANQTSAGLIVYNTNELMAIKVAKILQYKNRDANWKELKQTGNLIRGAASKAFDTFPNDPVRQQAFILQNLQGSKLDVDAAIKQALRQEPVFREIKTHLESRPWYFSEQRVGQYIIQYELRDGNRGAVGAVDAKDRRSKVAKLFADPNVNRDTIKILDKTEQQNNPRVMMGEQTLEMFQRLEQADYEAALATLGEDAAKLMRSEYNPGDASQMALEKARAKDFMKNRRLAPGREHLNIWETAVGYYNAVAGSSAKMQTKALNDLILNSKEFVENPDIQRIMVQHNSALLEPASREYTTLKNLVFTHYLGYNFSSLMLEGAQPLMTLAPQLIREGAGMKSGYTLIGSAYKSLAEAYLEKGWQRGKLKFSDPVLDAHFAKAVSENILHFGAFDDLVNSEEHIAVNTKRLRDGKQGLSAAELAKNTMHLYLKTARTLYSSTSGTNSKIAFIAAHKLGQQKGLTGEALYNYAKQQVHATMYSGGKYNRPFFFDKLGKLQGAAGVVYTLNNFTFASIHAMSRLFKEAVGSTGLSGTERAAAGKAFATMLGTQLMVAGSLGLPFAAGGIQILEDIFGVEIYAPIREGLAKLGGDDQELGNTIADIAMNGMASHYLGVDVQGRLGMGSIGPFNAYKGFDLGGLFGATGGFVKNIYDGVKQVAQGEFRATNPALPTAFRKPLELYANRGNFLDKNGNLIMEPSTAEQAAYFLGFQPKSVSDYRLEQRLMRQADQVALKNRTKEYEELSSLLLEGQGSSVRQALHERQQSDSTFDAQAAARSIVELAVNKTLPKDPVDEGSTASLSQRQAIATTFQRRTPRSLELAKQQLRSELMSALQGRPVEQTSRQLLKSQLVDQLLTQNPNMPRSLALQLVDKQLNKSNPYQF